MVQDKVFAFLTFIMWRLNPNVSETEELYFYVECKNFSFVFLLVDVFFGRLFFSLLFLYVLNCCFFFFFGRHIFIFRYFSTEVVTLSKQPDPRRNVT